MQAGTKGCTTPTPRNNNAIKRLVPSGQPLRFCSPCGLWPVHCHWAEVCAVVTSDVLMRQSWRKFVVIAFFAWVLVDLTIPSICSAEEFNPPLSGATSAVAAVTPDSPSQQQSSPAAEDDCFCCCSHISPSTSPALVTLEVATPDWPPATIEHPRDFSFSLYHPPRS